LMGQSRKDYWWGRRAGSVIREGKKAGNRGGVEKKGKGV